MQSLHVVLRSRSHLWIRQSNANTHTICSVPHVVLVCHKQVKHSRPHYCAQAIVNLLFCFPSHMHTSPLHTLIIHTLGHKVKQSNVKSMSRNAHKCGQNMTWHKIVLDNDSDNAYILSPNPRSYIILYSISSTGVSKHIHVYFYIHHNTL